MDFSRRHFLRSSGALVASMPFVSLADSLIGLKSNIKVGLIGCGGRGVGALVQSMTADAGVTVTALADLFPDQIEKALSIINKKDKNRVDVPNERQFVGFDSYQKLIDSGVDIVLLCSPPNFRPDHLEYAVQAGKHIFCEKPVAVDIPGLKRIIDSVKIAKEKNLNIVSGFCFRYSTPNREILSRVNQGSIGEIKSITTFRYGGEMTLRPRLANWNDLEYEIRNWYYYQRYASDLVVEQSIHSVDYMNWLMNNRLPKFVSASGGRQSRPWDGIGNTYDHMSVEFDYGNGVKGLHFARQQNGADPRNSVEVIGEKGNVDVNIMSNYNIYGQNPYTFNGSMNNMYQTQHDELLQAIRTNQNINDGDFMINSTLLAIWARISAYTGKRVSYEQIMSSTEVLGPHSSAYTWALTPDKNEIAKPGLKKFI